MTEEEGEYKFSRAQQRQLNKNLAAKRDYAAGDKSADAAKRKNWTPFNMNKPDHGSGKGDDQRPRNISAAEYGLRYDFAVGNISIEEFNKKMEELDD